MSYIDVSFRFDGHGLTTEEMYQFGIDLAELLNDYEIPAFKTTNAIGDSAYCGTAPEFADPGDGTPSEYDGDMTRVID